MTTFKKQSNRANGNTFEQEFCEKLFQNGFWVHNLKQDNAGQPADIIAVKKGKAFLIDCKVCSNNSFSFSRIEENQDSSMTLWNGCGNGTGWFALKLPDESIYLLPHLALLGYEKVKSGLSIKEIQMYGQPFDKWVEVIV